MTEESGFCSLQQQQAGRPDRFWGSPRLAFSWYRGVRRSTYVTLVPRLKTPVHSVPLWDAAGSRSCLCVCSVYVLRWGVCDVCGQMLRVSVVRHGSEVCYMWWPTYTAKYRHCQHTSSCYGADCRGEPFEGPKVMAAPFEIQTQTKWGELRRLCLLCLTFIISACKMRVIVRNVRKKKNRNMCVVCRHAWTFTVSIPLNVNRSQWNMYGMPVVEFDWSVLALSGFY